MIDEWHCMVTLPRASLHRSLRDSSSPFGLYLAPAVLLLNPHSRAAGGFLCKPVQSGASRDPAEWLQVQLLVEALLICLLLPSSGLWTLSKPRQSISSASMLLSAPRCSGSHAAPYAPGALQHPGARCFALLKTSSPPGRERLSVCERLEEIDGVGEGERALRAVNKVGSERRGAGSSRWFPIGFCLSCRRFAECRWEKTSEVELASEGSVQVTCCLHVIMWGARGRPCESGFHLKSRNDFRQAGWAKLPPSEHPAATSCPSVDGAGMGECCGSCEDQLHRG